MCGKRTGLKCNLRKKKICFTVSKAQDYALSCCFLFVSAALQRSLLWLYSRFGFL